MHEAGVAARALEGAIAEAAEEGRTDPPGSLEVVFDPTRVTEDSLRFHLELALRGAGMADLPIHMRPIEVTCPACGAATFVEGWPLCDACGAALPVRTGPMAEARFAA